jgi:hypothetical protein
MKRTWRFLPLLATGAALFAGRMAYAQTAQPTAVPSRPAIMFNRWQEDWSVLADPRVKREPFDALKYIPLSPTDPETYLSFGLNIRERYEGNDAAQFGVKGFPSQNYLLSRTEIHGDLRVAGQLQVFVQLQSDFAPWKTRIMPADQNRLDLEQAFAALTEPVGNGILRLRIGRQQFAFDLQRFISVRDGPNVRQSYDAVWADYEIGKWRIISFYSRPVVTRDLYAFDDYSSDKLTLTGFRVERQLTATTSIASYYTHYTAANTHYLTVGGSERRNNFDINFSGAAGHLDWEAETMIQIGQVVTDNVFAWAVGSLAGYTFNAPWAPRLGIQVDAASGDSNPHDHTLGTFNPMFPNGYYVGLSGYTAEVNYIQVKPSITVHPYRNVKLFVAIAPQWRETTQDAVYTMPNVLVPGTAGQGGSFTGAYFQARVDWAYSRATAFAVEAEHFQVTNVLRHAGGNNGNYIAVQWSYGW